MLKVSWMQRRGLKVHGLPDVSRENKMKKVINEINKENKWKPQKRKN